MTEQTQEHRALELLKDKIEARAELYGMILEGLGLVLRRDASGAPFTIELLGATCRGEHPREVAGAVRQSLEALLSATHGEPVRESCCLECFKELNESEGRDPYAEREDEYVASCNLCGHDMER